MRQIKFLIFSTCIMILLNTILVKATEQKETTEYPYYTFDLYCKIYEFHPEYIKITDYVEVSTYGEKFSLDKFNISSSGALWDEKDLYDIEYSNIISKFDSTISIYKAENENIEVYINFDVYFKEALKGDKKYSFWMSYKTKRLPHLHTKNNISNNTELHFGLKTRPDEKMSRNYRILMIPIDSQNQEAFNSLPTKQIEQGNWKLFIYDLSEIKGKGSIHIKLKMKEDKKELKINEIIEKI
ncbi:hypothetical protein HY745_01590 [Candidatus Desantisbacteria bacterium]|nr:hypothetical protein [Candidatus Desantisbacteria bacterium]